MSLPYTSPLKRAIENWKPASIALTSFVILYFLSPYGLDEVCTELENVYFTLFSIALGFEISSLCLLAGFSNNDFFKAMKQMNVFRLYVRYHFAAFRWTLEAIMVSILALFFEPQNHPIVGFLFISSGVGALLAVQRVFKLFKTTLKNSGVC